MRGKKHEFSDEEIKYILDNWQKESPHSMKKRFNCTWYAVCSVAKQHGLELPSSNEWSQEEIATLIDLSDKLHYEEIARVMNKSTNAIYLKAKRLGITLIQDRRKWLREEEALFASLWGTMPVEEIAKKLKRTVFSLKVKAVRMGLGPMIRNNSDLMTVSDICELLSVSRDRVTTTWLDLGLNLQKLQLTNNCSYYVITWEDLINFLFQNQNEWDSRELEENIFGEEPDWLKAKRLKDLEENPLWYRRWTEEEVKLVENLYNSKKSTLEIAEIVDRSEASVKDLIRQMGYSFNLPKYWKSSEIIFLKENCKNMTYSQIATILGRTPKAVGAKVEELGLQKLTRTKK